MTLRTNPDQSFLDILADGAQTGLTLEPRPEALRLRLREALVPTSREPWLVILRSDDFSDLFSPGQDSALFGKDLCIKRQMVKCLYGNLHPTLPTLSENPGSDATILELCGDRAFDQWQIERVRDLHAEPVLKVRDSHELTAALETDAVFIWVDMSTFPGFRKPDSKRLWIVTPSEASWATINLLRKRGVNIFAL